MSDLFPFYLWTQRGWVCGHCGQDCDRGTYHVCPDADGDEVQVELGGARE